MTADATETYVRYLAAKQHVDNRSLNRHVWHTLKANLPPSSRRRKLEVVDFGAGIGTMLERSIAWGLTTHLHYTMVEKTPGYLAAFKSQSLQRRHSAGYRLDWQDGTRADLRFADGGGTVDIVCADLYDVISNCENNRRWDLITAHAVMDLVNIHEVLNGFQRLVKPGGLLYLTLNYDGLTAFQPAFDPDFEQQILDCYHRSMDQRTIDGRPSGSSQSGRDLLSQLTQRHWPILAAGSSDWIVYPHGRGYPDDDARFLAAILQTFNEELQRNKQLDPHRLAAWMSRRQSQIDAAELIFMARNIDFLVRVPAN